MTDKHDELAAAVVDDLLAGKRIVFIDLNPWWEKWTEEYPDKVSDEGAFFAYVYNATGGLEDGTITIETARYSDYRAVSVFECAEDTIVWREYRASPDASWLDAVKTAPIFELSGDQPTIALKYKGGEIKAQWDTGTKFFEEAITKIKEMTNG